MDILIDNILKEILQTRKEYPTKPMDEIIKSVAGAYERNVEMEDIHSFIERTYACYASLTEAKKHGVSRAEFLKDKFEAMAKEKGLDEQQKEEFLVKLEYEVSKYTPNA